MSIPPETVTTNVLVLLIDDDPAGIEPIREALSHREGWCRLQCVGSVPTGIARVAGGGVSLVLLSLSLTRGGANDDALSHFRQLHGEAPGTPIVVLCRAEQEDLALSAVRAGAADYMIKGRCATDLERVVQSVMERYSRPPDFARRQPASLPKPGTIISIMGVKGGVGTTTVALNVGSVLARRNKAIVAELRPTLGTLAQYLRPQNRTRNITSLLSMEPAVIAKMRAASCLWPYRTIPGLSLLFGPQAVEPCQELGLAHAKAILAMLAGLADFIVCRSARRIIGDQPCGHPGVRLLALVIERDSICIQAAKMILEAIAVWNDAPQIGAIIVNRTPLPSSASIAEIEMQLGIPIFGVIPPAPDVCSAAQNARTPLVAFDSESLVAGSMTALADTLVNPGRTR
jgi:MinD-like ATPase involved in chromosome partitioning or flagellar assembly/CheY-like chemotaxis protein